MSRKRSIIIIEAQHQEAANHAAVEIVPNPADISTFIVPLSYDGAEPATHFICSVVLDDDQRSAVMSAMSIAAPTAFWWRLDGPDPFESALLDTNVLMSASRIGQIFNSNDTLNDVGLEAISDE